MNENPHSLNRTEASKVMSDLESAIANDTLKDASPELLRRYLSTLCSSRTGDTTNALHIVQGLVVNHEYLVRHVTKLDAANGKTQKWFMVLAVVAILAAAVQGVCAVRSELRYIDSLKPSVTSNGEPSLPDDANKEEASGDVKSNGAVTNPIPAPPNE